MFEFLRKLIVPIIITVLVFFVAMIVLEWGADITSSRRVDDSVGIIDGQKISYREFEQYYSNLLRQEQEKTEEELSAEKTNEIRNQAWSQLVADYLINREVEKRKITLTPEEIYQYLKFYPPKELQSSPQFMTDGKFDYQKYVNAMVNPENARFWAQLESYVLPELKKSKLQLEIINTVRVTPSEVLNSYLDNKELIKVGYINIPSSKLEPLIPVVGQDEMQAYFDSHKEDYKVQKRATVELVLFEKAPTQNDWDKANYQMNDIYDSLIADADFGEMARTYSEDVRASADGDLGWIRKGMMVPEFDSAAWSLTVGEISRPVKTRFGYHIIKFLEEKTDVETPPGADKPQSIEKRHLAHILMMVRPSQETLDQLYAGANDFAKIAGEKGFNNAAKEYNYTVKTTPPFTEGGYIQYVGSNPEAVGFVFANKVGTVSDVIETNSAYVVLNVASHIPEGYLSLDEARPTVTKRLKTERAVKLCMDTAQLIYNSLMSGTSFGAAGQRYGFPYELSAPLTPLSTISNIGDYPEVLGTAFGLKYANEISKPVRYGTGVVILTLLERSSANLEDFNKVQDSLRFSVTMQKSQEVYGRWFDNLMKEAKVENYLDRFYKAGE